MASDFTVERLESPTILTPAKASINPPQISTLRKRPCCTKCGKPMLGHKRGCCEMESTPTKVKGETQVKVKEEDVYGLTSPANVATRLATLCIDGITSSADEVEEYRLNVPPPRKHSSVGVVNQRMKAETLASLASRDKAVLDMLGKPGMMSNDAVVNESIARSNVERWLESVPGLESPKPSRQKRPKAPPFAPSPDFDAVLDLPPRKSEKGKKLPQVESARALTRASKAAEQEEFFDLLAKKSKKPAASVFTVEMKDLPALEENAKRLKLHACIIVPKYADGSTGIGWLVVGKDEESVKSLFAEVEKEVKSGKRYMSTLGSFATGVTVAWTCLAFS